MVIAEPVTKDGETVGTIFLVAPYSSLTAHLLHYIELRVELQMADVPLIPLMEEVAQTIKPLMKEMRNHFQLIIEQVPQTLWTDRQKLRQILINLLSNAAKFTTNGEVSLKASCAEGWIEFAVKDTGIGIPFEKLDSLFLPFIQIHS